MGGGWSDARDLDFRRGLRVLHDQCTLGEGAIPARSAGAGLAASRGRGPSAGRAQRERRAGGGLVGGWRRRPRARAPGSRPGARGGRRLVARCRAARADTAGELAGGGGIPAGRALALPAAGRNAGLPRTEVMAPAPMIMGRSDQYLVKKYPRSRRTTATS